MKKNTEFESHENTASTELKVTNWTLGKKEIKDHILIRLGYKRMKHLVTPGLYSIGSPGTESPVFVTANYTLSFDSLRSSLKDVNCFILVLDTQGVNVWCAAGEGAFGTDELVNRIEVTKLGTIVNHRRLILPQLGAPGINAFEVQKRSGFNVEYGPVRAKDLPEYLKTGRATPEMRIVKFNLKDRLVLIPVELTSLALPLAVATLVFGLIGGLFSAFAVLATVLSGIALFPLLLPWLPTKDFSSKGFTLGILIAVPFAISSLISNQGAFNWLSLGYALTFELLMPPIVAFIALNFTGSSTFTSRCGVRKEIFRYIPIMATCLIVGTILAVLLVILQFVR